VSGSNSAVTVNSDAVLAGTSAVGATTINPRHHARRKFFDLTRSNKVQIAVKWSSAWMLSSPMSARSTQNPGLPHHPAKRIADPRPGNWRPKPCGQSCLIPHIFQKHASGSPDAHVIIHWSAHSAPFRLVTL
jgi:hypothetical protein